MLRYVARSGCVGAIPTLFLIVTISFFLMRVAPGGPFDLERPLDPTVMAEPQPDLPPRPAAVAAIPPLSRQSRCTGDFGPSFVFRDFSVDRAVRRRPAGLASSSARRRCLSRAPRRQRARHRRRAEPEPRHRLRRHRARRPSASPIPTFVIAPLSQLVFGVWLGWLPAGGWGDGALANMILPIVTLALPQIAIIARLTRGSMIEALRSNHVRTARAYGLPACRVVVRHALRGAVLPVVSYPGPAAAALLTGSVVVETIFGIPGIGRYFVQAALNRDYTLVMGTVVVIAVFIIVFNLVVDILYAVLDPRVRYD